LSLPLNELYYFLRIQIWHIVQCILYRYIVTTNLTCKFCSMEISTSKMLPIRLNLNFSTRSLISVQIRRKLSFLDEIYCSWSQYLISRCIQKISCLKYYIISWLIMTKYWTSMSLPGSLFQ